MKKVCAPGCLRYNKMTNSGENKSVTNNPCVPPSHRHAMYHINWSVRIVFHSFRFIKL